MLSGAWLSIQTNFPENPNEASGPCSLLNGEINENKKWNNYHRHHHHHDRIDVTKSSSTSSVRRNATSTGMTPHGAQLDQLPANRSPKRPHADASRNGISNRIVENQGDSRVPENSTEDAKNLTRWRLQNKQTIERIRVREAIFTELEYVFGNSGSSRRMVRERKLPRSEYSADYLHVSRVDSLCERLSDFLRTARLNYRMTIMENRINIGKEGRARKRRKKAG